MTNLGLTHSHSHIAHPVLLSVASKFRPEQAPTGNRRWLFLGDGWGGGDEVWVCRVTVLGGRIGRGWRRYRT